jgi:flavin-dependent dehydrogenase
VDPFTGEGIWQALFTGMAAGTVVAKAVDGELTPELCRQYEEECDARIRTPSRKKAGVQDAMRALLRTGL